jgi:hypothetical protein
MRSYTISTRARRATTLGTLLAATAPLAARAQAPATPSLVIANPAKVFTACFVVSSGTVYRIDKPTGSAPGAPSACGASRKGSDVEFTWTDGDQAVRVIDLAGGDVGGTFGSLTVARLLGRALASTPPTAGQVLQWTGTEWAPATVGGIAATSGPSGPAGGDLAGSYPNPTVAKIQGVAVASTTPASGQVLAFDGQRWTPSAAPSGGVTAHGQLTGLTSDDHPQYLLASGVRGSRGLVVTSTYEGLLTAPATGAGTRMMWYPGRDAFRAGSVTGDAWDTDNIGLHSVAFGEDTRASGDHAAAFGFQSVASGRWSLAVGDRSTATASASTALGQGVRADGLVSIALGQNSRTTVDATAALAAGVASAAYGFASVAMGNGANAVGSESIALGFKAGAGGARSMALGSSVSATGDYSAALGSDATTNGKAGAFVLADAATINGGNQLAASADNQLSARFAGGYRLFSSAALNAGVSLAPGGGAWQTISDVRKKTAFRDVDGERVLAKLAAMPVRTWQYRTQDAAIRHMGPTAQDFHRAFGVGESDTTITTVDADGVALAAARALEARTRTLAARDSLILARLDALTRENAALRRRASCELVASGRNARVAPSALR